MKYMQHSRAVKKCTVMPLHFEIGKAGVQQYILLFIPV
jgi:hypothetical protein